MSGLPATKSQELTSRVNRMWADYTSSTEGITPFAWKLLFKELTDLERTPDGAGVALLLQTVMWALKGDEENIARTFNIYAGRFGKNSDWYIARATIAPLLGKPDMLLELLDSDYPKDDFVTLTTIVNAGAQIGLYISARNALDQLCRNSAIDIDELLYISPELTRSAANYLELYKIDEIAFARRLELSTSVVRHHLRNRLFSLQVTDHGILFEYVLDLPIDKLIAIDNEINDAICSTFEESLSEHISIGVTASLE
ncbi:hypothetical protein DOQ73_23465 [Salmonella enterica subsp. enterica]|nr:hypothetical protein [Salmonella enterica subsp. enterica serovar Javiana]